MTHIFFIAGEPSGDMHGANVIQALKQLDPDARCSGLGGRRMEAAGMELVYDLAGDAIMGFVEVLRQALPLRRLFLDTVARVRREKPDCVVLIDYPGFNIRFAAAVKKMGIPVVYYISPQVWAWKRRRLDTLAALVTKMLVIFPFEEELYRNKGMDCVYVGHPLVDEIARYAPPERRAEGPVVGLLPGSRLQEIRRIGPVMAETGAMLLKTHPDIRFLTPCVSEARAQQVKDIMGGLPVDVLVGGMYDVLSRARCCLVASGTATIETALFGAPMCIVYKVNPVSYWLARVLVRIRFIGMVNILAEREVAPELIQHKAQAETIVPIMRDLIDETERRSTMVRNLEELKRRLGGEGASQRAAEEILRVLRPC